MILLYNSLKSVGKMALMKTAISPVNYLFINNKVRMYATESAVQKITIRTMKKPRTKIDYSMISWFLLVIPASAFGLGTWQVFRKFEKDKINEEFLKKLDKPPVDLPEDLDELKNMEYRKVRVKGTFDHSKELYFGPRGKIDELTDKVSFSLLSRGNAGYQVITPFKLSDRNLTILINRGWVPPNQKKPYTRLRGQVTEEVELVGLVRFHENRKPLGSKNIPEKNSWVYRDLNQMSKATGAAPILLDADKSSTIPGGPCGGQTIVGLPNDHLSYIYTWYGLAAVSGYLWYIRHFQRLPIIV